MEEAVAPDDCSLHELACEHFGTWETALRYAGIDLQRVAWEHENSADAVRAELRRLLLEVGDLTSTAAQRDHRLLYNAARRHFGTWKKAVRAARDGAE